MVLAPHGVDSLYVNLNHPSLLLDLLTNNPAQAGSVPPSGSHLVPLNIDVKGPYPLGCHLGFDDQNHHQLVTQTANSGDFNLTNTPDNGPQVFGQSSSAAADSASALPTASTTGAPAGATTVFVSSVPQDASSGVSTGAIAGIVVGALAAVASVIGALFFLCIRKRRRDRRRIDAEDSIQEDSSRGHSRNVSESQAFMVGEMAADPKPRAELMADTQPVMEKDGEEQRVELPTKGEPEGPVEMEASLPYEGRMKGRSLKR